MRISDWSSDVCSSDLAERGPRVGAGGFALCPRFEVGELVGWRGGGFAGRSGDGGGGIAPDRIADRRREQDEGGNQYHAIGARHAPSLVRFHALDRKSTRLNSSH